MKRLILIFFTLVSFNLFAATTLEKIRLVNPNVDPKIATFLENDSKKMGVPVDVMIATIARESNFKNLKENSAGAAGMLQMKRDAFREGLQSYYGISEKQANSLIQKYGGYNAARMNPELAMKAGTGYMSRMIKSNNGNIGMGVLAYNQGPGGATAKVVKDEGKHYVTDIDLKIQVLKKAQEKGINSLTDKERKLLKNAINTSGLKENYKNSISNINKSTGGVDTINLDALDEQVKVNYDMGTFDFDALAETLSNIALTSGKKIGNFFLVIASIFLIIQVAYDSHMYIADGNFKSFLTLFFRRIITFTFYNTIVRLILNGTMNKMVLGVSSGIFTALTGVNRMPKINSIWNLNKELNSAIFHAISSVWGLKSVLPWELQKDLIFSLIMLIAMLFITIGFILIMFNVMKIVLGYYLGIILSTIPLIFGMLDATKTYFNIGKILSMTLNFIAQIVGINFVAYLGIKILSSVSISEELSKVSDSTSLFKGSEMVEYVILIFVIYYLIKKMNIKFE